MNRRWRFGSAWRLANVAHKRKHLIESLSDPPVVGSLAASPVSAPKSKHRASAEGILSGKTKARATRDAGFAPSTAYNASGENQLICATLAECGGVTETYVTYKTVPTRLSPPRL